MRRSNIFAARLRRLPILSALCATLAFPFASAEPRADEGMYPVSELERLPLAERGLRMPVSEIFDPNDLCLLDGICRVDGCTGSFVSPDGLIITNHHCAYRAIQTASTPEHDYLTDGFVATTRADEIPAPGYTVRITESYREVSDEVLSVVTADMSFLDRSKAIEKRRKELERQAETDHPGLRAEVGEMFAGKTYVLFLYTYLKDVRLVFAPPDSVGEFGGAIDNWEWPRHTGDFSFMRAYVAPDGSSAEYSPDNVPFRPKRHLRVQPAGVRESDYVMLLGYPGRTARHRTSHFLEYERDVRLPHLVDLYGTEIGIMEAAGAADRGVALKLASRMQGLENVEKRSRGQLKGLRRAGIVPARQHQEAELQAYIDADPERRERYGSLLTELDAYYDELTAAAPRELDERSLTSTCRTLSIAFTLFDAAHERAKEDLERESPYMDRNWPQTLDRLRLSCKDLDLETDRLMLAEMLRRLGPWLDPATLAPLADGAAPRDTGLTDDRIGAEVDRFFLGTRLGEAAFLNECLERSPDELVRTDDSALKLIALWYPRLMRLRELDKEREGREGRLYGELQTIKAEFLATNFVPDANGTLRLTFGHVRGFSPEDAVYKQPFTTLQGMLDKGTGTVPFVVPQQILERVEAKDFGAFVHPDLGQVPVAMLYDTDTTGGNSGSPVLNADGELVGVNFDRCFEATINDFAWNENYSRSIGVDIRYVLWITGRVFGGDHLLREMGVEDRR